MEKSAWKVVPFFIFVLSGCQPNAKSDSVPENDNISVRFDQSQILPIDSEIITQSQNSRRLPNLNDSRISYCESIDGESGQYSGLLDQQKYPLASVSKVFVSAWALQILGPNFTFNTTWRLKNVPGEVGTYDAYLNTQYDPVMNIEKIIYMLSVLQSQGVKKIRNLVVDESVRVFLSVLNDPHYSDYEAPVGINKSIQNLSIILNSSRWGSQTAVARQNVINYLVQNRQNLILANQFSVGTVNYQQKISVDVNSYTKSVIIKSAPLSKYLKEMNVESNNYIADSLFNILGGVNAFKKFQIQSLKIKESDLIMLTGSGLPIDQLGYRADNKSTCVAVLKVWKFIKGLSDQLKINSGKMFLNPSQDIGTFNSTTMFNFNNGVILKTGRLLDVPSLNLSGTAYLNNGKTLYFSYMAHDFDNSAEDDIKSKRDAYVSSFLKNFPVAPRFNSFKLDQIFF